MFHPGDLHSGIATAIAQQKFVACFIHTANEESQLWEGEWLGSTQDGSLGHRLREKAVLLRIELGSQEAGFLAAFCPIERAPALVVIHNGQVVEKLEANIGREEFETRVLAAVGLEGKGDASQSPALHQQGQVEAGDSRTQPTAVTQPVDVPQNSQPESQPQPPTPTESPAAPTSLTDVFPNRAQRMEAEAARQRATEKQERIARARARREEAEAAAAASSKATSSKSEKDRMRDTNQDVRARQDWLLQQKKRKDEAKEERERILKQIENDRLERKRQERERKEEASRSAEAESSPLPDSSKARQARTGGAAGTCALQIRLFDGSSVKGRFASSTTLGTGVRSWIREAAGDGALSQDGGRGETPFGFRQILAPQPARPIEIGEENMSLLELGLTPNATLVLIPITNTQDAYAASDSVLGQALGAPSPFPYFQRLATRIAGGAFRAAVDTLSYVTGIGGGPDDSQSPTSRESNVGAGGSNDGREGSNVESGPSSSSGVAKLRVKTLADQRAEEEAKKQRQAEFYNGNSLGFEGRKDDGDGTK